LVAVGAGVGEPAGAVGATAVLVGVGTTFDGA
jgi:hypothetical protein